MYKISKSKFNLKVFLQVYKSKISKSAITIIHHGDIKYLLQFFFFRLAALKSEIYNMSATKSYSPPRIKMHNLVFKRIS